jgi:hypothetical protein
MHCSVGALIEPTMPQSLSNILIHLEMAELFDATKQNISLHLKNFFEDGELEPAATVKESLTVQIEGTRKVQRPVKVVLCTFFSRHPLLITPAIRQ